VSVVVDPALLFALLEESKLPNDAFCARI